MQDHPNHGSYDVVIIGGAIMGSAVAWFLARNPGFGGRVLVVERDPSYEYSSTARSNSCIRQQFSDPLNVRVSQYGARYIRDFRAQIGDARAPVSLDRDFFGYLYLASDPARAEALRADQRMQAALGAGTRLWQPAALAAEFPFMRLDDIVLGSWNRRDEGYFDGAALFEWWRRAARARGVEYVAGEAVDIETAAGRAVAVRLGSGARISCALVVNAAGARAARVAAMAGLDLPVEPRKRMTWLVEPACPLPRTLPLTIDPSGVHFRSDGGWYMIGAAPEPDRAVAPDDFAEVADLWEERAWPALARRIPAFERLRLRRSWVGHYAYNAIDQNAILGPHPELEGFLFINGFSGHGLQQAPAMGRGLAEWIVTGRYQSLDLSGFGWERILRGSARPERAVI